MQAGGLHFWQPPFIKPGVLLRCQAHPFPLHITWPILGSYSIREFGKQKNQFLDHYLTSYIPHACRPLGSIWLHSVTPNYLTCVSCNFFIFCPISLTSSHKFLHTYCSILSIKNSRRFDDSGGLIPFITGRLNPWIVESTQGPNQSSKQDDQSFISILNHPWPVGSN